MKILCKTVNKQFTKFKRKQFVFFLFFFFTTGPGDQQAMQRVQAFMFVLPLFTVCLLDLLYFQI